MNLKQEQIARIAALVENCDDVSLLNLIVKLLEKDAVLARGEAA